MGRHPAELGERLQWTSRIKMVLATEAAEAQGKARDKETHDKEIAAATPAKSKPLLKRCNNNDTRMFFFTLSAET